MYVLHSYADLSKESFVPFQPQFEGIYLACTHYLSVNIAVSFSANISVRHFLPWAGMTTLEERAFTEKMSQNNGFITGLCVPEENHSYIKYFWS